MPDDPTPPALVLLCVKSPGTAEAARQLASRLPAHTLVLPLQNGLRNAEQAHQATRVADGVIQGASVVRRLMASGPDAVGDYVAEVRAAIDAT